VKSSNTHINIQQSLDSIYGRLGSAAEIHSRFIDENYEPSERAFWEIEISDHMEAAFDSTLLLIEAIGLSKTYEEVFKLREIAKSSKGGFSKELHGEDEPYLLWRYKLWHYLTQISDLYIKQKQKYIETYDLKKILKSSEYSITDTRIFEFPPQNEDDVHLRIENILKCYFQDLKTKPTLSKPIKNFIPDSGIPSIKTLIEYK